MLQPEYSCLSVDYLELDKDNPRIAKALEYYGEEISSEAMSLALKGSSDETGTSFTSLRDSIKTYGGIMNPIIVNRINDNKYRVIEGNTRLLIYKEFREQNLTGQWDKIPAMVYSDMDPEQIHSIRLQAHLVGHRNWDPYAKARYLHHLSFKRHLTISQIIDYCGGNRREVNSYIDAYNDMEKYYRPIVGDNFDITRFSAFVELQQISITNALTIHKFGKDCFAKWVNERKFGALQNIRKLPRVLNDPEAKKEFLDSNMEDAWRLLETRNSNLDLSNITLEALATEISRRSATIELRDIRRLRDNPDSSERIAILDAMENLSSLCNEFEDTE